MTEPDSEKEQKQETSIARPAPLNTIEKAERLEERLKGLVKKHPEIVEKVRANLEKMYELSVSQLEDPRVLKNAIGMSIDGILRYPERVFIAGRLISAFPNRSRSMVVQALSRDGQQKLVEWYNEKGIRGLFTGDRLRDRIIDKNLYHFVQFWDIHTKGKFNDPDWRQLEESLINLENGINRGHYPLLPKLHDGLQHSALECFIEDSIIEKIMGEETKTQSPALPPITRKKKKADGS